MGTPGLRAHVAGLPRLRRRLDDGRPRGHPLYPDARRGCPRIRTTHCGPEVRPAHDAPSRRGRPPRLAGEAVRRGPAGAGRARPQVMTKPRPKLFGSARAAVPGQADDARVLRWCRDVVSQVNALGPEMQARTDEGLRALTGSFRGRLSRGERLDDLLPEAFAA